MYIRNGQEVEVLCEADEGFLAAPILDFQDGYGHGPLMLVDTVYEQAPTARFDTNIATLKAQIEELHQQKLVLCKEMREAERRAEERRAKFKRLEALQGLEDFIDGKVTHYVVNQSWGLPQIVAFADAICDYDKHEKKLLTLFGDSDGNLAWKLCKYSDGSGSYFDVVPCLSHEDAVEMIAVVMRERMAKTVTRRLADHAVKYGVPLPEGYMECVVVAERKDTKERIVKLRQKIEDLETSEGKK